MREPIPVLFVCYNRLAYSVQAMQSIVDKSCYPVAITAWDNCSSDGTQVWLRSLDRKRYCIEEIVLRPSNEGLARAVNYFFRKHHAAKYVVKVDCDTILPDRWLEHLVDVADNFGSDRIGAISGTCLRPNGKTFEQWVREDMYTVPFRNHQVHFNTYVCGTGVLINMDMIRSRGLLFEGFPCKISGWTDYTRIASEIEKSWRFAFYSAVPLNLLNLAAEHVLSNDFPAYDRELATVRNSGNAWWDSVGGLPGVKKFIDDHGGLNRLTSASEPPAPLEQPKPRTYLTTCDAHAQRATLEFWEARVTERGTTGSTFLDQDPARTAEFTRIHEGILREVLPGKDVCEVGAGWGRLSYGISRLAKSYVGTDFVQRLVDKAKESLPHLDFRCADARHLPFLDESFDVVVALTCVSSFDEVFQEVLAEMKRVLRPGGRVLFLEEEWARSDWKLENQ